MAKPPDEIRSIEDVPEGFTYVFRTPVRAAIAAEGFPEEREDEILVALHRNDERELSSSPFFPRLEEVPDAMMTPLLFSADWLQGRVRSSTLSELVEKGE